MKATEVLMSEHRGIERMLAILEAKLPALEAGDFGAVGTYAQGADFLRGFADKCHHHKEEGYLFPALEAKGMPRQGGPIGVMLAEHDQGRTYIRAIVAAAAKAETGDRAALKDLAGAARGYTQLLRAHIQKEDQVLFQMANRLLTDDEQQALAERFEVVEEEVMGAGTHERYHHMLDAMEKSA